MIETALCDQAKLDMMNGVHHADDVYRLALYSPTADINAGTRKYTTEGEISGTGYPRGGIVLEGRRTVLVDGVACMTFRDISVKGCSFSTAGGLVYNASKKGAALAAFAFDEVKSPSNGAFELEFPLPTPSSAVISFA